MRSGDDSGCFGKQEKKPRERYRLKKHTYDVKHFFGINRCKHYLYTGECVGMCLCVCAGRQSLMQGFFVSQRLEAVNSVVLKICIVLPSG